MDMYPVIEHDHITLSIFLMTRQSNYTSPSTLVDTPSDIFSCLSQDIARTESNKPLDDSNAVAMCKSIIITPLAVGVD